MSGRAGPRRRRIDEAERLTAAAWERFAAGEEVVDGVRPEILLSWQRCRDEYAVDPGKDRAPPAERSSLGAEESVVAAELGAAAMSITNDVLAIGGVVAVADGNGRILAAWGDETALAHGRTQNLGPAFAWTEAATGTTGVGTALASHDPVAIRWHEHWCSAFHDWSCAAVAVRDPMSDAAAGVIDVSVWNRPLPAAVVGWLTKAVAGVEERLHQRAARAYGDLVDVYQAQEAGGRGVAVLDAGGRVVRADATAQAALDAADVHLRELARSVAAKARREQGWLGTVELTDGSEISVEPVVSTDRVVGVLVRIGGTGERLPAPREETELLRDRLVGVRGQRLILVGTARVRLIELSDGIVWLDTDEGRLRSPLRGLDQLEDRLRGSGFLRVNRRVLVNLQRVREVAPSFKGGLWVLVDGSEALVSVSRRRAAALRAALGL